MENVQILRPGYCLSNGSIITKPAGQFLNTMGDVIKDHQSQFSAIAPIQGGPASATVGQSALTMATTAGATGSDLTALMRFDGTVSSAGTVLSDDIWLAGLKLDLRYGNNMQPSPFTCLIRPVYRNIVTNVLAVDTASSWDHTLVPNGGANSSSEFFFLMGRSSLTTTWDATNSQFSAPSQQQSRICKSLKMITRDGTAGSTAAGISLARLMAQDLVFEGVVVILQGQNAITQSSSVSPFFGSYDSPNVLRNLASVVI